MIYCVEDDDGIRQLEVYTLKSSGYSVAGFSNAKDFFAAVDESLPELVILDIMLPETDGVSILKMLREGARTKSIPVIMATAKGQEYDKVLALDLGADDYLVKPFGMMEMVSRVRAVLRRSGKKSEDTKLLRIGSIVLDIIKHRVMAEGKEIELTFKEFELLRLLMSHPGMAFTRDKLLTDIWGQDYDGETRTVDVHIRTLRQKLGKSGDIIETVRGVGYRMEDK